MKGKNNIRRLLVLGILGSLVMVQMAFAEVKISDTGYREEVVGNSEVMLRRITVDNGRKTFGFRTNGRAVGKFLPTAMNWNSNEFCTVSVGGETLFGYDRQDDLKGSFKEEIKFNLKPGKEEGVVEAVREGKAAKVTLTFALRENEDFLRLTVKVEPFKAGQNTVLEFECYPSTADPRPKLSRAIATSKRTEILKPGDESYSVVLAGDERWVLYYDDVYDLGVPTLGPYKAVGGCGLFYVPSESTETKVMVASYHMNTFFALANNVMHLAIFDFANEKSNAGALKYMQTVDQKYQDIFPGTK